MACPFGAFDDEENGGPEDDDALPRFVPVPGKRDKRAEMQAGDAIAIGAQLPFPFPTEGIQAVPVERELVPVATQRGRGIEPLPLAGVAGGVVLADLLAQGVRATGGFGGYQFNASRLINQLLGARSVRRVAEAEEVAARVVSEGRVSAPSVLGSAQAAAGLVGAIAGDRERQRGGMGVGQPGGGLPGAQ